LPVVRSMILKKQDRGEADELVIFLSRELGWLRGVAKNAKKSRVRFGGHLEPFSLVDLTIRSRQKDTMVWIDEAQALHGFLGIRSDIQKVAQAAYFFELTYGLLPENQPDKDLFEFLAIFLYELETTHFKPVRYLLEEIRLLGKLGYAPRFDTCPNCGEKISVGQSAFFSLSLGGACHRECLAATDPTDLVFSPSTIALVRRGLEMPRQAANRLSLNRSGRNELRRTISAFVKHLLGKQLNSLAFLEKMEN
jgi:DNA repair protein RecO (recombination protein O)